MLRRIGKASFLLFLLSSILFSPSIGGDTLTPDQPLADGGSLISAGGSFVLGFFSPDGSNNRYIGIWYHKISVQTSVWVANRQRPVTGGSGRLSVKTDGTLVLTDENSTVTIWSSSSPGLANPVARLLDNGNFVVVEAGTASRSDDPNSFAWQSFDYPTDTLLPGMKLGWNLTSGLNRNLTAWATGRDPAPGDYTVGIDLRGDPQLFVWFGTLQSWRGGPWNGLQFSGTGGMNADYTSNVEFVVDPHQVVYSFYPLDPSIITRLVMHQSGILQRLVWIEGTESWNVIWIAPKDQCDDMLSSPCGANGVCDVNNSPYCSCLSGFSLDSPGTSDGYVPQYRCMRSTALDCRNGNGTDGFRAMRGLKLPDTSTSMVHRSMNLNLEQCRALCLRNCSCTAFASANVSGSGSGCIIWTGALTDLRSLDGGFGQDLYVRLAAADLVESKNSQWSRVVVITVVPALAVFLLACVACCVWRRKKRKHCIEEDIEAEDLDLPLFDLSAIVNATGNFSIENKLGQGGFGPVYKGKLEKEQDIAVKRLSKTSMQGVDEFKNEVMLIAKLQHRNLVRLIGCCIQGGERILIYEYMPNGSLDAYLFDKAKGALLDWQTRYNIMIGIARGLLYLHHDSRLRIIHRDLKTSNILLDNNMNPKISDFGMARIFGADEIEINTKRVVGTYGYMSPEYAMDGIFSIKSDVFSFGVLMLEIISGKRNRGVYHSVAHLNLLGHIWSLWKEGKSLELVDTSIGQSFSMTEVLRCIKIGLLCVQEWPTDRPTMSSVVVMLGSDSSLLPEPKQPGFIDSRGPPDSSSNKKVSLSANKVSVTVLEGR